MPDDDDKEKTERVYRLETEGAPVGYTATGQCIECLVMGERYCSMHGVYEADGKEKE